MNTITPKNKLMHGLASLAIGAFLLTPVMPVMLSAAQPVQTANAGAQKGEHGAMQKAISNLNLNDDQKNQVSSIFADAKTKRDAIRSDNTLSSDQKRDKMKALHADTRAKVDQVLTPDQRAQLKQQLQAAHANAAPSSTPQQ
jgi:Spy/CpxP family protein refolding chaperone